MTNPLTKVIAFASTKPDQNDRSPFNMQLEIEASSSGAGVLYGAEAPSRNEGLRYITAIISAGWTGFIVGTGTPDSGDIQNTAVDGAFIEAGGTLARADNMSVIVLVNGQTITRVAKGSAPSAGQYRVFDDTGVIKVEFGTTYGAGTKVEVLLVGGVAAGLDSTDANVVTIVTLAAFNPVQIKSREFFYAGVVDVVVRALGV